MSSDYRDEQRSGTRESLKLMQMLASILFYFILFFFFFLWPHLQHMEVPRLGVESELQPLAYTMATATQDPSCVCDLPHSSRQHRILNPLSEARDRTTPSLVGCDSTEPQQEH